MDPQLIIQAAGPGYSGFLIIDTLYRNRSSGGVRIAPDLEIQEVLDLAREMSHKYAILRLPRGGAKAGLRMPLGIPAGDRTRALRDFGRHLRPLIETGLYYPGMDLGCGPEDLMDIYRGAGIVIGPPTDSSFFTALSVAASLQAAVTALGLHAPVRLGIAGYGRVADHLIRLLPTPTFQVVSVATLEGGRHATNGFASADLVRLRAEWGDRLIHHLPGDALAPEAVLVEACDVLLPAARTRALDRDTAARLRTRAVLPIANAPYDDGVVETLTAKGVLCLPGFVVNSGGVLGSSLYDQGISRPHIERFFAGDYREFVLDLLRTAGQRGMSPVALAQKLAEVEILRRSENPAPSMLHTL